MASGTASASVSLGALALLALATASPLMFHRNTGILFDEQHVDIIRHLPDGHLNELLSRDAGDEYTKLERMLVSGILTFRDKLSKPQTELGLPALDPFVLSKAVPISVANNFANLNANLASAFAKGVSQFSVSKLSLYLVERVGVLDLELPGFFANGTLDVTSGSWLSPLRVPVVDKINVKFSSPKISLGLRGKISVKESRLSMESATLKVDLGDWSLDIVSENMVGTLQQNPGLNAVVGDLVKSLAPRVIRDWTPVLEKYFIDRLDEKLQDLQIADIIHLLDPDSS